MFRRTFGDLQLEACFIDVRHFVQRFSTLPRAVHNLSHSVEILRSTNVKPTASSKQLKKNLNLFTICAMLYFTKSPIAPTVELLNRRLLHNDLQVRRSRRSRPQTVANTFFLYSEVSISSPSAGRRLNSLIGVHPSENFPKSSPRKSREKFSRRLVSKGKSLPHSEPVEHGLFRTRCLL